MTISSATYANPASFIGRPLLDLTSPSRTPRIPSLRLLPMKIKVTNKQFDYSSEEQKLTTKSLENQLPLFEFDKYMAMKKSIIEKALDEAVPLQHPEKIHQAMRYSLLSGGKRIRPVLCLACCDLVGGDESLAIPTACAIEMIQAMSLIQDDLPCMDNDDLRHGKPSTHKAFGEETAILAGDALLSFAFEHMAASYMTMKDVSPQSVLRAIHELASGFGSLGVMGGQFMDKYSEGKEVTLKELEYIHVLKSSKLVEASVVCGAIIGGGNEIEVEKLRKFAWFLGLLGQVRNDILDVTKSSKELGKTAGKDLESDKATYPKLMGIDGAKNYAGELATQAFQELAHFDAVRTVPLYGLVNYISRYVTS